jgi:hypothetical protein
MTHEAQTRAAMTHEAQTRAAMTREAHASVFSLPGMRRSKPVVQTAALEAGRSRWGATAP